MAYSLIVNGYSVFKVCLESYGISFIIVVYFPPSGWGW